MEKEVANQEIREKYDNKGGFFKKMQKAEQKYQEYQQLALYSEPSKDYRNAILSIKVQDDCNWCCFKAKRINLEIMIGNQQPVGSKSIQKFLLTIISYVPRPSRLYSIFYINTLAGNDAYNDFKKIFSFLPIQYFHNLEKIYVLHAPFKSKALDLISFDYLTNYVRNKTIHLSSFEDFVERVGINGEKILNVLPKEISVMLSKQNKVKPPTAISLKNPNTNNQSTTFKLPEKAKSIEDYEAGQTGAPLIIELLIYYFNGREELLSIEGVFRKSVSIEDQTLLLQELEKKNYNYIQTITDPHLIANAIKRILSKLAEPFISYKAFTALMDCPSESLNELVIRTVKTLDNSRKMTLLLLIDFFKEKLLAYSSSNRMTEDSLGIVLGPCLMRSMRSEIPSMKDLIQANKINLSAMIMIRNFEVIFGAKRERMKLIRQSVRIQERQSLKQRLGSLQIPQREKKDHKSEKIRAQVQDEIEEQSHLPLVLCNFIQKQEQPKIEEKSLTFQEIEALQDEDQFLMNFKKK